MTRRPTKLLFFVTEDWYFCSHRLPLAVAARDAGFEVVVVTRVDRHGDLIQSRGLRLIPIRLNRQGINPIDDLVLIARLYRIYRRERPHIVHHVAMKPVLYGSLAAWLGRVPAVINALAGMGFLFSSRNAKARLLQPLVRLALRLLLGGGNSRVILQNPDDVRLMTRAAGLDPQCIHLIRGSGVNLEQFHPRPEPPGPPVVMLPSRLLWDKGVGEFVSAARILRNEGTEARFVLVGKPDPGNPASVPKRQLAQWIAQGLVEWWGHSDEMAMTLAQSHIVCLPSYREGLPKVLLEAAASGRPVVTTDAPGCREVVQDRENGLLVAIKDSADLAHALRQLIQDPADRARYGRAGRARAEAHFGIDQITAETLAVYLQSRSGTPCAR